MAKVSVLPKPSYYTIRTPDGSMGDVFFTSMKEAEAHRRETARILKLRVQDIAIIECETTYYYHEVEEEVE